MALDPQLYAEKLETLNVEKEYAIPIGGFKVQWEDPQESFRADDTHRDPKGLVRVLLIFKILLSTKSPDFFHNVRHEGLCGRCICHHVIAIPEGPNERRDHGQ